jgi:hypothetical protein
VIALASDLNLALASQPTRFAAVFLLIRYLAEARNMRALFNALAHRFQPSLQLQKLSDLPSVA